MIIKFVKEIKEFKGTLIFPLLQDKNLSGLLKQIDHNSGKKITSRSMKVCNFKGKEDSCLEIVCPEGTKADRIILLGLGQSKNLSLFSYEKLGSKILDYLNSKKISDSSVCIELPEKVYARSEASAHIAFGALMNSYRFNKYFSEEKKKREMSIRSLLFVDSSNFIAKKKWYRLSQVAEGVFLTRNLVSEPANIMTPVQLSKEARKLSKYGIKVEILDEKKIKILKMGALLGVAQGSANKPYVVSMSWIGNRKNKKFDVSFVGKGVTFDTGGISIKPSGGMEDMKWDMGGSAVVIGLMRALAGRKVKANVSAVIGLVENMPSGTAQRPGDVVRSMSGKTIEVLNTDAEGRLVLADAVWFAQKKFKPNNIIDLATLTGAIIISLGQEKAGLFCNNKNLESMIHEAGNIVEEKVWSMPIDDSYDKDIASDIADMKNVGSGRGAGSTAGAMFIKRFINDIPWAHIDIAGVTWSKKDRPLIPKGGTAYGVRILEQLVSNYWEK